MGKKYIVELGRCERLYKASVNGNGKPNLTWLSPEVDLTPYTEPDIEQVRKEAYDKGYEDAEEKYNDGYSDGYDAGLSDAWEAARKIGNMPYGEEERAFGSGGWKFIENHTADEAIEKIRQYEQKQEEQIQVGDEVVSEDDIKAVVIDMDDYLLHVLDENGLIQGWPREDVVKTDRHFPDIAAVLKRMRGEQDE